MLKKKNSILLLGATFGTDNMGVGALTMGALQLLFSRYPNSEVSFLDYGKRRFISTITIERRSVSVPLVNLRFTWKIFLRNNVAFLLVLATFSRLLGHRIRQKIFRQNLWLRNIGEADLAVALSGGDSFTDMYGLGRFFYVFLPQLLVVVLGRRLIIFPQTIGPFRSQLSKFLAIFIMRRAEIIYSRDYAGVFDARQMLRLGNTDPKVQFCYDLGFLLEARRPARLDVGKLDLDRSARKRLLVGLNVSGLLLSNGYDGRNTFDLIVDYRELIFKVIQFFITQKGADVLLVPHVFGSQVESDSHAARAIYGELRDNFQQRLHCAFGHYNQNEIKYVIGRCDFFIGSRMHACIAALSQSIPTVAIAYSRKFIGVLQSIGAEALVVDPRQVTIEEILLTIDRVFLERQTIKSCLDARIPGVRDEVLRVLNECA